MKAPFIESSLLLQCLPKGCRPPPDLPSLRQTSWGGVPLNPAAGFFNLFTESQPHPLPNHHFFEQGGGAAPPLGPRMPSKTLRICCSTTSDWTHTKRCRTKPVANETSPPASPQTKNNCLHTGENHLPVLYIYICNCFKGGEGFFGSRRG